jgi:uncharacterized protein YraI
MSLTRFIAALGLALSLTTAAAAATIIIPTMAPTLTTTRTNLNLRTGPGLLYPVAFVIPAGSAVNIVSCGGTWCIVTWAGQTGYSDGSYLQSAVTVIVSPLLQLAH